MMGIFLVEMWMQYSTGILRLGLINPADEDLPAYALLALVVTILMILPLKPIMFMGPWVKSSC